MQVSHSRVECWDCCPYRYMMRYKQRLALLPDDKPDNALYLGTALHTGLEIDTATAIRQYYSNFPVITDEIVNEAIKLEVMIAKAREAVPDGRHEVAINDPDMIGAMDLLVPVGDADDGVALYDLYDYKYSNNKRHYLESDQLHIYKYFFERDNPGCRIRNMYYLMIPKSRCKRRDGEELMAYRRRLRKSLDRLQPALVPVEYDPDMVIRFLLQTKRMVEADSYPKRMSYRCQFCEYQDYCQKGHDYMILPSAQRRQLDATKKKVIWIYGAPFSGKTTFANKFPMPLMLNTDGNIKYVDAPYIAIRDEVKMSGRMTTRTLAWDVFKDAIEELEKKANDFKTIVVDLLEDTYEQCRRYVCQQHGWDHESDDSFRAWDMVRTEYLNTLKRIMAMDYDNIVLISHMDMSKDITKKSGDKITAIKPNIPDKIANKVAGMVDIVARAVADDGKYTLNMRRNEVIFGGGRLVVKEQEIPLDYDAFCRLYEEANNNLTHTTAPAEQPVEKPVRKHDLLPESMPESKPEPKPEPQPEPQPVTIPEAKVTVTATTEPTVPDAVRTPTAFMTPVTVPSKPATGDLEIAPEDMPEPQPDAPVTHRKRKARSFAAADFNPAQSAFLAPAPASEPVVADTADQTETPHSSRRRKID